VVRFDKGLSNSKFAEKLGPFFGAKEMPTVGPPEEPSKKCGRTLKPTLPVNVPDLFKGSSFVKPTMFGLYRRFC
jgi:hypothetical protein